MIVLAVLLGARQDFAAGLFTFGNLSFNHTVTGDDDGYLEKTSWAAADDRFLVIDQLANDVRDTDGSDGWGDGVIDQSNELVLSSLGEEGDTVLEALARYDEVINGGNGVGFLNAADAIWNELKVWQRRGRWVRAINSKELHPIRLEQIMMCVSLTYSTMAEVV